ncbi:hypothetical protein ILYODFUR_018796 [Ilyodon furcidens]|uniref:Uncharacterized protein n=1 Tax=Ilyodon furcidens TaxID=33524 RepID=A0ABV0TYI7_9TELE
MLMEHFRKTYSKLQSQRESVITDLLLPRWLCVCMSLMCTCVSPLVRTSLLSHRADCPHKVLKQDSGAVTFCWPSGKVLDHFNNLSRQIIFIQFGTETALKRKCGPFPVLRTLTENVS